MGRPREAVTGKSDLRPKGVVAKLEQKNKTSAIALLYDAHKLWNGNKELKPEGLLRWMDDHDIEKSVLLPLTSPESSSFLLLTEPALNPAANRERAAQVFFETFNGVVTSYCSCSSLQAR